MQRFSALSSIMEVRWPHRQTADYIHSIYKLFEVEREWSKGLSIIKVDLARAFDSVRRDVLLGKLHCNTEEFRVFQRLLTNTSCLLCSPWNQTSSAVDVGIRQGAVESPLFFSLLMEWALRETIDTYQWKDGVSTYADMLLAQLAYVDDCLLWEGDTTLLQRKLEQFQKVLSTWGLKINVKKCSLYVCPGHRGPPYVVVNGQTLEAKPSLEVMGIGFRVGANSKEPLQGTWQRAKNKFWSAKHLLLADAPLPGRMRLLDRIVGGSILWNACAFPPQTNALEAINSLMNQLVVWMLRLRKHGGETWTEFRQRSVRQARQMILRFLPERWSSQ